MAALAAALVLAAPALAEPFAVAVDGKNSLVLSDSPCNIPGMAEVMAQLGMPAKPLMAAVLVVSGKRVEACWVPHAEPLPHVDFVAGSVYGSAPMSVFVPLDKI